MKDPFDATQFKDYIKKCEKKRNQNVKSPSLFQMGWIKATKKTAQVNKLLRMILCPGLTIANDSKIDYYLKRTSTLSGGSFSLPKIAEKKFKCLFSMLIINNDKRFLTLRCMNGSGRMTMQTHKSLQSPVQKRCSTDLQWL